MSSESSATVEFVSASTAGIVYVELGFIPERVEFISDHAGTPKFMIWVNNTRFPNFPAANSVQIVGGSAAFAPDTNTLFAPYAGGDPITSAETANTAGKHVDRSGGPSAAGRITAPGVTIAAAAQVNSGRNVLIAYRGDR
jgi:hypothetical protein